MTSGGLFGNSSVNCIPGAPPFHGNCSANLDSSVNSEVSNGSIPLAEVTPMIFDDIKTPDISLSHLDLNSSRGKKSTETENTSTFEALLKAGYSHSEVNKIISEKGKKHSLDHGFW